MFTPLGSAAKRPVYTLSQLERYFAHIHLPRRDRETLLRLTPHSSLTERLELLTRLQRHQVVNVPWENLSKFYNPIPGPVTALLNHNEVFKKIVGRGASGRLDGKGGRGGGCLENNTLFSTVLRSLGYDLYTVAARVNVGSKWSGWGHMASFVNIGDTTYAVDVGFGRGGPISPLPLVDSLESDYIRPAQVRLVKGHISDTKTRRKDLWLYQRRASPDAEWNDLYALSETEFLPVDYENMSIVSSYRRNSFFSYTIAMARMVMAYEIPDIVASLPNNSDLASAAEFVLNTDPPSDEIVGSLTLIDRKCKINLPTPSGRRDFF